MDNTARQMNAEMNAAPLLDVLLVLIVVFLASLKTRTTMDAQLPVPCEAACDGAGDAIVLEVLEENRFLLNRQPVAVNELSAVLARTYVNRPDKILQVAGHERARYQDVLAAMDVARSAGVRVIGIPPSDSYDKR